MKDTTLVIMAAGLGSRFGSGIKQLAKMNKADEIIMDYSIFDAVEAGFNRVIIIIRHQIEAEFKAAIGGRLKKALVERGVELRYVYQELDALPGGYTVPEGRTKPWGTTHALLSCKGVLDTPFVVINADDYYGKEAFRKLREFLLTHADMPTVRTMAMAGFVLENTVSPTGAVNRGVCLSDCNNKLTTVVETTGIRIEDGVVHCANPVVQPWIRPGSLVSMNMWAAYPAFLDTLEEAFLAFLADSASDPLKKESLIPGVVDHLLKCGGAAVTILPTADHWIGITYQEDLPAARAEFASMIEAGQYPPALWERCSAKGDMGD